MVPRRSTLDRLALTFVAVAVSIGLAACSALLESPPAPTPADFQGIAADLVQRGVRIDNIVSGDAGCDDQELARTAIGLDAEGLDQDTPTRVYLYIFRNREAYERLRQSVDACARSYVTDPAAYRVGRAVALRRRQRRAVDAGLPRGHPGRDHGGGRDRRLRRSVPVC